MGKRGNLRALAGYVNFIESYFQIFLKINFDRLFKTSSNPRATASKQKIQINKVINGLKKTIQIIVIATVEFSVDNTEETFADLSGNKLPINVKHLIGL